MRRIDAAVLFCLLLPWPVWAADSDADLPIPQDPAQLQKRREERLAWNRQTLAGAYDKVGKKNPRWDSIARKTFEAAARHFSQQTDPEVTQDQINALAQKAIEAGCNDPLILYLHALTCFSSVSHDPGIPERKRRWIAAADAMEASRYPAFRRYVALSRAIDARYWKEARADDDAKHRMRMCKAILALLPTSVREDRRSPWLEDMWYEMLLTCYSVLREETGSHQTALAQVEAAASRIAALKPIWLQAQAEISIARAWQARGEGFASKVTEEGWRKFGEGLREARHALEESWKLKPGNARTATMMIKIEMTLGHGDREAMEKWFRRAMKADGDCLRACQFKMNYLDPKWHGTPEELLAFAHACRDTKNWKAGITLLLADAHLRLACRLKGEAQSRYWASEEVWKDIHEVYEEYLKHYPTIRGTKRCQYAAFCYVCNHRDECKKQFLALGSDLFPTDGFSEDWLKAVRATVGAEPKPAPEKEQK